MSIPINEEKKHRQRSSMAVRNTSPSYLLTSCLIFFIVLPSFCATTSCQLTNEIVPVEVINGQFVLKIYDNDLSKLDSGQEIKSRRSLRWKVDNNTSDNENIPTVLNARECPCSISLTPTYCLITSDNENRCKVSENGSHLCYYGTTYDSIIRTFWPVVVLWYAAVALYFYFKVPSGPKSSNTSMCVPLLSAHKNNACQ